MSSTRLAVFHWDMNFVQPRAELVEEWLHRAAAMGYNAVLWEVEDKVAWESLQGAWWPEAFSKEQLARWIQMGRSLGLEPIPLLQCLGHAEYVLKNPPFQSLREDPRRTDCYCPSRPATHRFLASFLEEMLEVFGPVRFFHLGGDEAHALGTCPACHARIQREGWVALLAEHFGKLATNFLRRGIRPCLWADMLLQHPHALATAFPRDFVLWDWDYWSADSQNTKVMRWGVGLCSPESLDAAFLQDFPEALDEKGLPRPFYSSHALTRMGFDVVLCGAARSGGDSFFCPAFLSHARNLCAAASLSAHLPRSLGFCATSWAIRLNPLALQAPCLAAACYAANQPMPAHASLQTFFQNYLGSQAEKLLKALDQIGGGFLFAEGGSSGVQWNGLKDSSPPPPGWISHLLKQWRAEGAQAWQRRHAALLKKKQAIEEGLSSWISLQSEIPAAALPWAREWTVAAGFQIHQADLAVRTLQGRVNGLTAAWQLQKELFQVWLGRWETDCSAAKNAGLVFDALLEHASNNPDQDTFTCAPCLSQH